MRPSAAARGEGGFHRVLRQDLWLLHQLASRDEVYEFTEGVTFGFPFVLQATEGGLVGESERAAEGVGYETMGEVVREEIGVSNEIGSNVGGTTEGLATILARRIDDSSVCIRAAVLANRVVSFEHEAERIDLGVAVRTGLNTTMFL